MGSEAIATITMIIRFLLDIFIKDKSKKIKMIEFIEQNIGSIQMTVDLREEYERQKKELEQPKDSNSTL